MWIILCTVLLILAVLLLAPVRVRASYRQGEAEVKLRYGPVKIRLFPMEKKPDKPKKPEKKKKKPAEKEKKRAKAKINREQVFYAVEKLPPIFGRAVKRMRRRILIEPLHIEVLVAGTDPADTAALYGRLATALAAGLPVLQRTVRVREQDIRLYPDFAGNQMDFIADVGVSVRPWDVLAIGACAGAGLLKWFLGFRKLASPPPKEENDDETTAA